MILNERDARHEHILQVARQMMTLRALLRKEKESILLKWPSSLMKRLNNLYGHYDSYGRRTRNEILPS